MAVLNVHTRKLPLPPADLAPLIDGLGSAGDRLWPTGAWPVLHFDRPLSVGARGGHDPVGYDVCDYVPGQWVRFRFRAPRGLHGWHEFTVRQAPGGGSVLRHTLVAHLRGPARLTWPLLYRPMHDALLEDALDNAERELAGRVAAPARWSARVRLLRRLVTLAGRTPARTPR